MLYKLNYTFVEVWRGIDGTDIDFSIGVKTVVPGILQGFADDPFKNGIKRVFIILDKFNKTTTVDDKCFGVINCAKIILVSDSC